MGSAQSGGMTRPTVWLQNTSWLVFQKLWLVFACVSSHREPCHGSLVSGASTFEEGRGGSQFDVGRPLDIHVPKPNIARHGLSLLARKVIMHHEVEQFT